MRWHLVLTLAFLSLAASAWAQTAWAQTAGAQTAGAQTAGAQTAGAQTTVNNETADRAFLGSDGIAVPDAADQSPGSQRRADIARRTALFDAAGDLRLSRLLGAGLFATSGERLATVRDVMLGGPGAPLLIVVAHGRTIAVPWRKLAFGGRGSLLAGKAVLPGASRYSLAQLPEYKLPPARAGE